jgi:hypothetical protein
MIQTIEIPPERWNDFLKVLNRHAAERPIRVEYDDLEVGVQELGRLLPFRELAFEGKGSERGNLILSADSGPDRTDELTHEIPNPKRIYAGYNEAAEMEWLAIDEGSAKTFLYFEHLPAMPEWAADESSGAALEP